MAELATKEAEDSMKRIVTLNQLRNLAAKRLLDAEAEVKLCRRQLDKAEKLVFDAITEESTPTLFSTGVAVSAEELESARQELLKDDAKPETASGPVAPAKPAGDESWRQVPIEQLELPGKVTAALKSWLHNGKPANLDTLGGLADWKSADRWFTDVKGVGKAAADKIEDAIAAYFAKNPIAPAAEATKPAQPDVKAAEAVTEKILADAGAPATIPAATPAAEPAAPATTPAEPEKKKRVRTKKAAAK